MAGGIRTEKPSGNRIIIARTLIIESGDIRPAPTPCAGLRDGGSMAQRQGAKPSHRPIPSGATWKPVQTKVLLVENGMEIPPCIAEDRTEQLGPGHNRIESTRCVHPGVSAVQVRTVNFPSRLSAFHNSD